MAKTTPLSGKTLRKGRFQKKFTQKSRVHQSFKKDCDINYIISRAVHANRRLSMTEEEQRNQRFIDCTGADFQRAQEMISRANSDFETLPSDIRERFGNDPRILIDWLDNPANKSAAQALGLMPPDAPSEGEDHTKINSPDAGAASQDASSSSSKKKTEEGNTSE